MTTMVAYLRAAPGHDLDAQRAAVEAWTAASGGAISAVYRDGPKRGTAGRSALLRAAEAGRVGRVVVASACRLAPTLPSLLLTLRRLRDAGVPVVAANDPGGLAALAATLDALDTARAGLRRETAATGRERAQRGGARFGRPSIEHERVVRVRAALASGASIRQAARAGGVGVATAHRVRLEHSDDQRQKQSPP